jgi:hypothetical protein
MPLRMVLPTADKKASEWDNFKDAILNLYVAETHRLEGVDGVIEVMKTRFGFENT